MNISTSKAGMCMLLTWIGLFAPADTFAANKVFPLKFENFSSRSVQVGFCIVSKRTDYNFIELTRTGGTKYRLGKEYPRLPRQQCFPESSSKCCYGIVQLGPGQVLEGTWASDETPISSVHVGNIALLDGPGNRFLHSLYLVDIFSQFLSNAKMDVRSGRGNMGQHKESALMFTQNRSYWPSQRDGKEVEKNTLIRFDIFPVPENRQACSKSPLKTKTSFLVKNESRESLNINASAKGCENFSFHIPARGAIPLEAFYSNVLLGSATLTLDVTGLGTEGKIEVAAIEGFSINRARTAVGGDKKYKVSAHITATDVVSGVDGETIVTPRMVEVTIDRKSAR